MVPWVVGRFPGGFFKREARPSEYEILIARLVDRAIRPLFPKNFHAETQVVVTLISGDKNFLPDCLACLAASSAIAVSNIPFECPISEVRVGRVDGQLVVNPTVEDMERSDIDMIVAASMDNIMMVEGEMNEISGWISPHRCPPPTRNANTATRPTTRPSVSV